MPIPDESPVPRDDTPDSSAASDDASVVVAHMSGLAEVSPKIDAIARALGWPLLRVLVALNRAERSGMVERWDRPGKRPMATLTPLAASRAGLKLKRNIDKSVPGSFKWVSAESREKLDKVIAAKPNAKIQTVCESDLYARTESGGARLWGDDSFADEDTSYVDGCEPIQAMTDDLAADHHETAYRGEHIDLSPLPPIAHALDAVDRYEAERIDLDGLLKALAPSVTVKRVQSDVFVRWETRLQSRMVTLGIPRAWVVTDAERQADHRLDPADDPRDRGDDPPVLTHPVACPSCKGREFSPTAVCLRFGAWSLDRLLPGPEALVAMAEAEEAAREAEEAGGEPPAAVKVRFSYGKPGRPRRDTALHIKFN